MNRLIFLTAIAVIAFSIANMNCVVAQVGLPSQTLTYNSTGAGFSGQYDSAQYRKGEACAYSVLAIFAFGDASIEEAAGKAEIKKIASVSHNTGIGHVFQSFCTVVRGY